MHRRRSPSFPLRRTAGSVVLLVLVTVLLAAFMITKFVERAGTELLADARAGDQARYRREAYSALETTLAVLADVRAVDHALYAPAQGWSEPLAYAGYVPAGGLVVDVDFADESSRISLPRADAATLEGLFQLVGVDRNQAERASDALLVWMHPDYVPPTLEADPGNYERAAIPHKVAGRPLHSLGELASVAVVRDLFFEEGRPNERLRQFAAAVSLQSFDRINVNAASPLALAAAGVPDAQITALQQYLHPVRSGAGVYFKSVQEAGVVLGTGATADRFGVEIQVLRITITVRDGVRQYRLSAIVALSGGATAPARAPAAAAGPASAPPAEKAVITLKKLDYPFKVLELVEDVESGPASADQSPEP